MDSIEIPAREATPFIKFDKDGSLIIKGKSYDDDAIMLYNMIIAKVKSYNASTNNDKLDVQIFLKYFNTASSKCLYDLLETLKQMEKSGKTVTLVWNYVDGDEEMKEEIEDFKDAVGFNFTIEAVEDSVN
jgi:hypothetical protein